MDFDFDVALILQAATPIGVAILGLLGTLAQRWNQRHLVSAAEKAKKLEKDLALALDRIAALEAAQHGDFPRWMRDVSGRIMSVSDQFVRVFLAPFGLGKRDVIGARFEDLHDFDNLSTVLHDADREVLRRGWAIRAGVEIAPGSRVTICKTAVVRNGDTVFVAVAVPEEPAPTSPGDVVGDDVVKGGEPGAGPVVLHQPQPAEQVHREGILENTLRAFGLGSP